MKILVTGASGFIGGRIVESLATSMQDVNVLATGRSSTDRFKAYANVTYFTHDLKDELSRQACDVCIHCAGLADDRATAEQYTANNVIASKNLLAAVAQCRLFVFMSSASVYNFSDGNVKWEEDASIDSATSKYGRSKFQSEQLVMNSGIQAVYILRPRAVYGRGDRVLLPRILGMIRRGKMIVPSTLSRKTSLTNIQNLCEAVGKAILQSKPGTHVFNVTDREDYDLRDVLGQILAKKTGRRAFIEIPTGALKAFSLLSPLLGRNAKVTSQSLDYITQNSVMSTEKAVRELNYQGEHEFYGSLDEMIA